ncbi:hypothetical protein HDU96_006022 [Phlyctochytrium bullatum]|nr:hypothetical protein HDU96_006022 [Phlyctochytrium bullatum]
MEQRRLIEEKYAKRKDDLLTEEMIGKPIKAKAQALEAELAKERKSHEAFMHREMTALWKHHQREMALANVPLFKDTDNPQEVQLQRKVVNILAEMMPEGYLADTGG